MPWRESSWLLGGTVQGTGSSGCIWGELEGGTGVAQGAREGGAEDILPPIVPGRTYRGGKWEGGMARVAPVVVEGAGASRMPLE